MANPEHEAELKEGVEAWNAWQARNPYIQPDIRNANLSGANLREVNLREANLSDANLSGANLGKANLSGANLREANLSDANLSGANLSGANLGKANLSGADLKWANLGKANLSGANLSGADLSGADLSIGAYLREANLSGADLSRADLRGTNLNNAILDHSKWSEVRLDNKTQLKSIFFSPKHEAMQDSSDTIIFSWRDKWINWSRLRTIGEFPLFGVSWSALALALITINTIDLLNKTALIEIIKYPIPIPERTWWILLSSTLLVIGSTLYRWKCPQRIQTFSETEWVEEHGHPRQLYIAESLSRGWLQWPTLTCSLVGGVLAIGLVIDRLSIIIMRHWL